MRIRFASASFFLLALLALLSVGVLGAPPKTSKPQAEPARASGLYSDFEFIPEAGDVVGTEIFIVYGGGQHWALLQVAEGSPSDPALVPVFVSGSLVQFPFPHYGEAAVFKGRVTAEALEGTISGIKNVITLKLPRRRSYWQGK
jgi:hypothetical protein